MPINRFDRFGLDYSASECKGILNQIDFLSTLLGRVGIDDNDVAGQIETLTEEDDDNYCGVL